MGNLSISQCLVIGGIAMMVLAVLFLILVLALSAHRKKKLGKVLDEEFGQEQYSGNAGKRGRKSRKTE